MEGKKKAKFYHISKFGTKIMSWKKPKILTINNNNNNKQKTNWRVIRILFHKILILKDSSCSRFLFFF